MTRSQIQSKVRTILCDQLSLTPDQLADTTNLENDLKADSLDVTEIGMSLEDEFQITIEDAVMARIKTVGDAVDYICEAKGIPRDTPASEPFSNLAGRLTLADMTPAPSPAPLARDCKSCGAHSVTGVVCIYCGRTL
jgi:acyl carrier protein